MDIFVSCCFRLIESNSKLLRLVSYILSVYTLTFFRVHLNPNVAFNTHAKQPAFQIKHLQNNHQTLPFEVDTQEQGWKRVSLRTFTHAPVKKVHVSSWQTKIFVQVWATTTALVKDTLDECLNAY